MNSQYNGDHSRAGEHWVEGEHGSYLARDLLQALPIFTVRKAPLDVLQGRDVKVLQPQAPSLLLGLRIAPNGCDQLSNKYHPSLQL